MAETLGSFVSNSLNILDSIQGIMPPWSYSSLLLIFFSLCLTLFSLLVWIFYKTLSKKNIIELNLDQYNKSEHPGWYKFLTVVLYMTEYILILPFLVLVWYIAFSLFLVFTVEGRSLENVLFLSAALIITIRILSYYNAKLSEDLAKLFPMITLSVFLLSAYAFNLDRLVSQAYELSGLFDEAFIYFSAIFLIEVIMRLFYTLSKYLNSNSRSN